MALHLEHVVCISKSFAITPGAAGRGSHVPESAGLDLGCLAWVRQCLTNQLHSGSQEAHLPIYCHTPWAVHRDLRGAVCPTQRSREDSGNRAPGAGAGGWWRGGAGSLNFCLGLRPVVQRSWGQGSGLGTPPHGIPAPP